MSNLKNLARRIFGETLAAIDIPLTMQLKLGAGGSRITVDGVTFDLAAYERIYAIAIGKAAPAMARGLVALLGAGTLAIPSPPDGVRDWPIVGAQIYALWETRAQPISGPRCAR